MNPIQVGTSWRIQLPNGTETGWYMSRKQAVQGIDKLTATRLKKEHRVRVLAQLRAESYSPPTMTQEQER